jgi:hypothetical protein
MAHHWYWYMISFALVGGYGFWCLRNYRRRTAVFVADAAKRGWQYTERPPSLLGSVPWGSVQCGQAVAEFAKVGTVFGDRARTAWSRAERGVLVRWLR